MSHKEPAVNHHNNKDNNNHHHHNFLSNNQEHNTTELVLDWKGRAVEPLGRPRDSY